MDLINEIRWRPTIGDPTSMGWITVAAYALSALLILLVWYQKREQRWIWLAIVMVALCVNKQLDLQSLFTDLGRIAVSHQGWYEQRRDFQKWFLFLVFLGSVSLSSWFIIRHFAFCRNNKVLTLGLLFLLTFIVIRAISFHHFDSFLKHECFGVKMNWAIELGGISMIMLSAMMNLAKFRKTIR